MNTAIGGYFELELPPARVPMHNAALKFQSARAAFLALLRVSKPKRVWMPYYICDAMLAPVRAVGAEICYYSLDKLLGIADTITLKSSDLLLYVNYFGVCFGQVGKVLDQFNPSQVVLDFSQSFFSEPQKCLATIYSPRKFFGLPDGGLLFTQLAIDLPEAIDDGSEKRMHHLIARLGEAAELGYADYQLAELSLNQFEPRRMSKLTDRIFRSIDFDAVRIQRNKNFTQLHESLSRSNGLEVDLKNIDGPMCYPYISDDNSLKARFLADRIFIPTYWKEVADKAPDTSFELFLLEKCLPLPCDQRCRYNEINKIIEKTKGLM